MIHPYLVKVSDRAYLDNIIFHSSKMEPVLVGMKFLLPGPFLSDRSDRRSGKLFHFFIDFVLETDSSLAGLVGPVWSQSGLELLLF